MTAFQRLMTAGMLVLLVGLLAGCSRCSEDTTASPAQYRYKAGDSLHFRYHLTQGLEAPEAHDIPQGFVMKARLSFTVQSVDTEGAATLDLRITEVQAAVSEGSTLRPLDVFKEFERARYRIVQASNGRLLSIEQTEELSGGIKGMAESFGRPLREMFPILPPRLSLGSQWTIESEMTETLSGIGPVPSAMTTRYQVDGRESVGGQEGLRIKVNYAFTIGGELLKKQERDPKDDAAPEVDNRGEGEGTIWFDDKIGRFLGASYETRVTVMQRGEREGVLVDNSRVVVSRIEVLPDGP